VKGLYVGVPVKLGRGGVEQIIEITLMPDEQAAFDKSAAVVRAGRQAQAVREARESE